jgi:hypothetical protein
VNAGIYFRLTSQMEEEFEEEFYGVRGEYAADCWGEFGVDWAQTPAAATATAQTTPPPLNPELSLPISESEWDDTVVTGASGATPQFNGPYSKFKSHSKATTAAAAARQEAEAEGPPVQKPAAAVPVVAAVRLTSATTHRATTATATTAAATAWQEAQAEADAKAEVEGPPVQKKNRRQRFRWWRLCG